MLNLALMGDKDGDLYPEDDASSEKDIITLQQKDIDTDDDDMEHDDEEDEEDEEELNTDEESSVGTEPTASTSARRAPKERPTTFRSCLHSRPCTICVYLCLALLILASVVSLIVIGVLIVAPYRKAMSFEETFCRSLGTDPEEDDRRCSCGKGCNSKYPCINIKVVLEADKGLNNADDQPKEQPKVHMYENEATLNRECSYYPPCKSSRAANDKAVRDYERKFGTPGKKYPCLYNPGNPTEVIRTRRFHLQHVVHGMLWSSLIFFISLGILIFAIKKKGCDFL